MHRRHFAFLILATCLLRAQEKPATTQQPLTNDAVMQLVQAGVSDEIILAKLRSSASAFDTSTDAIIALKKAGVSNQVLAAMVKAGGSASQSAQGRPSYALQDANDPATKHDPGVYLLVEPAGGERRMIFIDRSGEASLKFSNAAGAAFSFGIAKAKLNAQIPGPRASVRSTESRPVFYMYFPDMSAMAAFAGTNMITSPKQFSLLSLEAEKNFRETAVARVGMGSASMGADPKRSVAFTTERVRANVYKVSPSEDLKPGEYAFIATLPAPDPEVPPSVIVYDFGMDAR